MSRWRHKHPSDPFPTFYRSESPDEEPHAAQEAEVGVVVKPEREAPSNVTRRRPLAPPGIWGEPARLHPAEKVLADWRADPVRMSYWRQRLFARRAYVDEDGWIKIVLNRRDRILLWLARALAL